MSCQNARQGRNRISLMGSGISSRFAWRTDAEPKVAWSQSFTSSVGLNQRSPKETESWAESEFDYLSTVANAVSERLNSRAMGCRTVGTLMTLMAGLPPNALSVNASTTVKGSDMVMEMTEAEFAESPRPENTDLTPWLAEKTLVLGKFLSFSVDQC